MRRLLIVAGIAAVAAGVVVGVQSLGDDRLSQSEAEAKGRDMLKSCLDLGPSEPTPVVRCERRSEDWSCFYEGSGSDGAHIVVTDQDEEVSIIC